LCLDHTPTHLIGSPSDALLNGQIPPFGGSFLYLHVLQITIQSSVKSPIVRFTTKKRKSKLLHSKKSFYSLSFNWSGVKEPPTNIINRKGPAERDRSLPRFIGASLRQAFALQKSFLFFQLHNGDAGAAFVPFAQSEFFHSMMVRQKIAYFFS
jgi:hypothetical protein